MSMQQKTTIRVGVVDDHSLIREGVKSILKRHPDISVVGEAGSSQEALDLCHRRSLDVMILDINLPGRNGLEVLKEVRNLQPRLPVLMLSMHPEERFALRSLRSGAAGYLNKESIAEELVTAIRKVVMGGRYVSPKTAEILAAEIVRPPEQMPHERLSDREFQVLCLIAQGISVTKIALQLSLSIHTINTYRARILEKMDLHSTAELIHYGVQNRLAE
jgi:two-component system invasion response regulator UvrY